MGGLIDKEINTSGGPYISSDEDHHGAPPPFKGVITRVRAKHLQSMLMDHKRVFGLGGELHKEGLACLL